ncbi:hypothetical protein LRQ04_15110 [Paenarthrobacter sp. AR 02]|uniref:hypothetical protein n=1 Tax=Paenarthrobacter sp. AR 02 TaxID=2899821 RepID=UPI001F35CB58|nr:hypothetical protein [Paenarthrobacter sp. AR 02]MCF3140583.1 hypothetical protein [Paenarthrobacter sp. AR 02]
MSLFTVLATSKVAAGVLAAGAVAAGGTGVAAFNGALPHGFQQTAHDFVGAPAPVDGNTAKAVTSEAAAATETAKSKAADAVGTAQSKAADAADAGQAKAADAVSDAKATAQRALATSPEAFGLCTSFLNGGLKSDTTVQGFKSLTIAAGGDAKVQAHCQAVVDAGKAAGLKVDGSAKADADVDAAATSGLPATPPVPAVPAVPAVPGVPAVPATPAAPAVPVQVPSHVPAVPGASLDSVR